MILYICSISICLMWWLIVTLSSFICLFFFFLCFPECFVIYRCHVYFFFTLLICTNSSPYSFIFIYSLFSLLFSILHFFLHNLASTLIGVIYLSLLLPFPLVMGYSFLFICHFPSFLFCRVLTVIASCLHSFILIQFIYHSCYSFF